MSLLEKISQLVFFVCHADKQLIILNAFILGLIY